MAEPEPTHNNTMEPASEKEITTTSAPEVHNGSSTHDAERGGVTAHLMGWQYKPLRFGPCNLGWYASPSFQLVMVSFVCFLCPGMFNAINGIGGGGQVDATTSNQATIALYCLFCVVGFVAGSIVNRIGIKITLSFGGIGYCIYVASFLCYNHTANRGFTVFAGALLGLCAALLWTAQGAIMMSYPMEADKGKYIATFWIIFNLGGVIGSLIPLGQNINNAGSGSVTDGTYAGFIVLMFLGAVVATLLTNAGNIIRKDGSRVIIMKNPSWRSELFGLLAVMKTDWYILLLFPMFFASNFFYNYQFQDVNLAKFTLRTRSLNSVLYWASQMVGAGIFGTALDIQAVGRSTRAKAALIALFCLTMIIWGGGYAFQATFDRATNPGSQKTPAFRLLDWTSPGYGGPVVLYMFYGFFDAAWQTCVYWFMGSLSNNSRKLANFAGFYKSIQSAGGVIAPAIDLSGVPYMNELAANWGLLAGSLLIAAPIIFTRIQASTPLEDDLAFSDETVADVVPVGTDDSEKY